MKDRGDLEEGHTQLTTSSKQKFDIYYQPPPLSFYHNPNLRRKFNSTVDVNEKDLTQDGHNHTLNIVTVQMTTNTLNYRGTKLPLITVSNNIGHIISARI